MGKYKGFAGSGMNANKNMSNVIKQAQKMQAEMEKVQEELEDTFSSFGALREWISNSLLLFIQSRQAAASQDTAVATVKAYIESHLSDELDRDTLAAMVYLNADYLSHLFKKDTGSSLINYVIDRRIARSKELLAKGEMSIRDIAITCGFQNISYFSRQFKKSTGMTPRQFKN